MLIHLCGDVQHRVAVRVRLVDVAVARLDQLGRRLEVVVEHQVDERVGAEADELGLRVGRRRRRGRKVGCSGGATSAITTLGQLAQDQA